MSHKYRQATRQAEESFLETAVTLALCIIAFGAWALVAFMLNGG